MLIHRMGYIMDARLIELMDINLKYEIQKKKDIIEQAQEILACESNQNAAKDALDTISKLVEELNYIYGIAFESIMLSYHFWNVNLKYCESNRDYFVKESLRLTFLNSPKLSFNNIREKYDLLLPRYAKYSYSTACSPYGFFKNLSKTTQTRLNSMLYDNLIRNLYSFPGLQSDCLTNALIEYLLEKFITEYLNI